MSCIGHTLFFCGIVLVYLCVFYPCELLFCTIVLSGGLTGLILFFVEDELGVLSLLALSVLGVLPVILFLSILSCLLTKPDNTV